METEINKFGLSRKTNIAIAAVGGISIVKESPMAIWALVLVALVAITYQFILDYRKG